MSIDHLAVISGPSEKKGYVPEAILHNNEEICFEEYRMMMMGHRKPNPASRWPLSLVCRIDRCMHRETFAVFQDNQVATHNSNLSVKVEEDNTVDGNLCIAFLLQVTLCVL